MSHQTLFVRRNGHCTYNSAVSDAHFGSKAANMKSHSIRDNVSVSVTFAEPQVTHKFMVRSRKKMEGSPCKRDKLER